MMERIPMFWFLTRFEDAPFHSFFRTQVRTLTTHNPAQMRFQIDRTMEGELKSLSLVIQHRRYRYIHIFPLPESDNAVFKQGLFWWETP
jgi:hypothetical protein